MDRSLLKELTNWKKNKNKKPLLLYGARQTGKTWLLKHFGDTEFKNFHYINFEANPAAVKIFSDSLSPGKLLPLLELHLDAVINPETDLLVFDEIQEAPKAVTSLKYFYEDKPEMAVACAGSFMGLYSLSESFPVGKITALTLHPMSFHEFLKAVDSKLFTFYEEFLHAPQSLPEIVHEKLWNRLTQYYFTGGMPEAVLLLVKTGTLEKNTTDLISEIQSNIVLGYRSDFAKHSGAVNANHIYRLFEQIPAQLSKAVGGNTKRFIFKDAVPDAKRYRDLEGPISWLNSTGLINICHVIETNNKPLSSNIKPSMLKLYLHDIGLLHSILGLSPTDIINQSFGTYKGYTAENYTASALSSAGITEFFNWKKNESEIEFLIQHNDHIIPIEVKSGRKTSRAKSLNVYREIFTPVVAIKMSGNNFYFNGTMLNLPLYAAGNIPEILQKLAF